MKETIAEIDARVDRMNELVIKVTTEMTRLIAENAAFRKQLFAVDINPDGVLRDIGLIK
jgi:CheY-specific phosphatase CheX